MHVGNEASEEAYTHSGLSIPQSTACPRLPVTYENGWKCRQTFVQVCPMQTFCGFAKCTIKAPHCGKISRGSPAKDRQGHLQGK